MSWYNYIDENFGTPFDIKIYIYLYKLEINPKENLKNKFYIKKII